MVSMEEFEEWVSEALDEIPEEFIKYMDNINIVVEDAPSREILEKMGLLGKGTLFGLYQGMPRTMRSVFQRNMLPDIITIYRRPILSVYPSHREAMEQVKRTVIHEVAHHFGISDRRLRQLGY